MIARLASLMFVAVLALSSAASHQGGRVPDPDSREIAAYRLTTDAMRKVMAATHAMVVELKRDPRVQERIGLETELRALEQKDALTAEDEARIDQLRVRRDSFESIQPERLTQANTLADMEAAIKEYQPLSGPIARAGMTPREYAKFFLALIQASLAASVQRAGMLKGLPPDVSRENVQFVLDHENELQKMQQDFQTLGGGGWPKSQDGWLLPS